MEDAQLGARIKAVRLKLRRTQVGLAGDAGVRPIDISHLEHGVLDDLPLPMMRRIVSVLGMWIELKPKWQGVELDRLTSGAHDSLQRAVIERFARLPGWVAVPEVTYSIFGERGSVDVLAWHEATRSLLVIELKTVLVGVGEIVRTLDQRERLATEIAAGRGWHATSVSIWQVFTDTRTNRRQVEQHAALLRRSGAIDGQAMRAWLRRPSGAVSALSFVTAPSAIIRSRVRPTKQERAEALAKAKVPARAHAPAKAQATAGIEAPAMAGPPTMARAPGMAGATSFTRGVGPPRRSPAAHRPTRASATGSARAR